MRDGTADEAPDLLVLLGDQVYADETSPQVRRLLRRRRRRPKDAPSDPGGHLRRVHQALPGVVAGPGDPLAALHLPSVMIFDDHEIIDDWNTSAAWRADMRAQPWWAERIASGLASYWVYQHLGNLAPDEIEADPVYAKVIADQDATSVLREFGARVDTESDQAHDTERWRAVQYQWSYSLDVGAHPAGDAGQPVQPGAGTGPPGDAAAGRVVLVPGPGPRRATTTWWSAPRCPGCCRRASTTSRPGTSGWPTPPHRVVAGLAERLRRPLDLEHWAAFSRSFEALAALLRRIGSGPPGSPATGSGPGRRTRRPRRSACSPGTCTTRTSPAPASPTAQVRTPVHQLTCSPIHNEVPPGLRPVMRLGWAPAAERGDARALARSAGVPRTVGALAQAGRAVLRQRGRHAAAHRRQRHGDHRGDEPRGRTAHGGAPAVDRE